MTIPTPLTEGKLTTARLLEIVREMDESLDRLSGPLHFTPDYFESMLEWRNSLAAHYMAEHYDPTPEDSLGPPSMEALWLRE